MPGKTESTEQKFITWMHQYHNAENTRQADALPLRRDMVTLLTFARDHKVVGTQSTGNMPLKAVREVTARFVNPPELDMTIGDRVYKLRTEMDVWALYFLHILAEVGNLLEIEPGQRWRLSDRGKEFLGLEPLSQVSFLLMIWWNEVNWLVTSRLGGLGEDLPPLFEGMTLAQLRSLPTSTDISFEDFADELIEKTGLVWTAPDHSHDAEMLRSAVERIVIQTLTNFGLLRCEYQEWDPKWPWLEELITFEITPLGRALLDAVAIVNRWPEE